MHVTACLSLGVGRNSRHYGEYAGAWRLFPQRGLGAEPLVGRSGGFARQKLKTISSVVLWKYSIWILHAMLEFMKYHVVKKNITCRWPSSYLKSYSTQVLLVVAYFSNDGSFTMKLTSNLYATVSKLVKLVLNVLFTVPARDVLTRCLILYIVIFNSIGVLNFYIVNFILYCVV